MSLLPDSTIVAVVGDTVGNADWPVRHQPRITFTPFAVGRGHVCKLLLMHVRIGAVVGADVYPYQNAPHSTAGRVSTTAEPRVPVFKPVDDNDSPVADASRPAPQFGHQPDPSSA